MMYGEVVVLSAVRTAVGKYGGALKDIPPTELAAGVTRGSLRASDYNRWLVPDADDQPPIELLRPYDDSAPGRPPGRECQEQ